MGDTVLSMFPYFTSVEIVFSSRPLACISPRDHHVAHFPPRGPADYLFSSRVEGEVWSSSSHLPSLWSSPGFTPKTLCNFSN